VTFKIDPDAAGFDATRLTRIDDHLRTRYIEPGKIAGCQVVVSRRGQVAHAATLGLADREHDVEVADDTIWRLYSMTKPITGVALLTLYETGAFRCGMTGARWRSTPTAPCRCVTPSCT
jgi:CubicO group peptidase (beta-lactamase class C family)